MPVDVKNITGNVPDVEKKRMQDLIQRYFAGDPFADRTCGDHLKILKLDQTVNEKGKRLLTIQLELTVKKEMTNADGKLHNGFTATLIDVCTIGAFMSQTEWVGSSTALNTTFYEAPAIGTRLWIEATSVFIGSKSGSATCQIWDASKNVLVATGTHSIIDVSKPPPPKL